MNSKASEPGIEGLNARLLTLGVLFFFVIGGLFRYLELTVLQSDPIDYLTQSQHWWIGEDHLPGYAFLIWALRLATFGAVPGEYLLQASSLTWWVLSVRFADRIISTLNPHASRWLVALYAFFPFLGLTYSVWPVSDSMVHGLVAMAFWYLLRHNWTGFTVVQSIGLITHKVYWPFGLLLAVVAIARHRYSLAKCLVSGLPLAAFWLLMVAQGNEPLWMVRANIVRHFPSYSGLPVFDGVVGTLMAGGARGWVKGGLLLAILLLSLYLFYRAVRAKQYEMLALLLPLILLLATLNQFEALASARFGKVLAIPLATVLVLSQPRARSVRYAAFVCVLLCSQLAYAVYMQRFFDPSRGILKERFRLERQSFEKRGEKPPVQGEH